MDTDTGQEHRAEGKRHIVDLFKELRDETTTLMHQEVELAKREMAGKATLYSRSAVSVATGGLLAFAGLLFVLAGLGFLLYYGLSQTGLPGWVAAWLAPVIVGAIIGIIGAAMIGSGMTRMKQEPATPERTLRTLRADKDWLSQKGA